MGSSVADMGASCVSGRRSDGGGNGGCLPYQARPLPALRCRRAALCPGCPCRLLAQGHDGKSGKHVRAIITTYLVSKINSYTINGVFDCFLVRLSICLPKLEKPRSLKEGAARACAAKGRKRGDSLRRRGEVTLTINPENSGIIYQQAAVQEARKIQRAGTPCNSQTATSGGNHARGQCVSCCR